MIHGYHEDYLGFVMKNYGKVFDIALRQMRIDPDLFQRRLSESYAAEALMKLDHRYIVGMSGTEILRTIMDDDTIVDSDPLHPPGAEYWAGYISAYAQWYWFRSFRELFDAISLKEILGLYHPYHEMDISQVNELIGKRLIPVNIIKRKRTEIGITQRDLAEYTDISLPTIRAYEQGELELGRAQADNIYVLSKVLRCSMEDLLKG